MAIRGSSGSSQGGYTETSPELRRGSRTRLIYRLVRVVSDNDEGLARCRNISDGGMALNLTMAIEPGECLQIFFSSTVVVSGVVAWVDGANCGLRFATCIDSTQLLRTTALESRVAGARQPRLKTNLPARVLVDGNPRETVIRDLSQHGMKLTHDGRFHPGLEVRVMLGGGKERDGVVRWIRGKTAGLFLVRPFSVEDLGSVRALKSAD